jgi:hypothetical protein
VNFSWIQSWHNSDTIIPALISIEKYTPFYWSENRFGMLVPLLVAPVRDYGWNLLAQSQIIVLSGIGVLVLLSAFDRRSRTASAVTVSLAAFPLFALFKPVGTIVLLLPGSPYLAALFLLLSALHLLLVAPTHPAMRWIAGAVLLLLSFWVNVSNIAIATVGIALWPATEKVSLKSRLGCLALAVVSALALIAIAERFPGAGFRQMQPVGQPAANSRERDCLPARDSRGRYRGDGRSRGSASPSGLEVLASSCSSDRRCLPDWRHRRIRMGRTERVRCALYRRARLRRTRLRRAKPC